MSKAVKAIDLKQVENLTFEGGGVAGVGYLGALEALDEQKILEQIKRVGGTSAGAMCAVALGVGCTPEEIKSYIWSLDFESFKDDDLGFIRDLHRLDTEFGYYKGEVFLNWLGDIIESKVKEFGYDKDITFAQLHHLRKKQLQENGKTNLKDIFLVGSNLSLNCKEIYSYEDERFKDMPIRMGARISMSIPFFFKAITREHPQEDPNMEDPNPHRLVDGGVFANDPQGIFDHIRYLPEKLESHANKQKDRSISSAFKFNRKTIALRLDTQREIAEVEGFVQGVVQRINSLLKFGMALITSLQDAQLDAHSNSKQPIRTVYIDRNDTKATDFDITEEQKTILYENGKKGVQKFIKDNEAREIAHAKAKEAASNTATIVVPSNTADSTSVPVVGTPTSTLTESSVARSTELPTEKLRRRKKHKSGGTYTPGLDNHKQNGKSRPEQVHPLAKENGESHVMKCQIL